MARRTSVGKTDKLNATGKRVRELREKKGWSQMDFATQLQLNGWDIDPATLNRIENRNRTVTDIELLLIAKVLNVKLQQFQP